MGYRHAFAAIAAFALAGIAVSRTFAPERLQACGPQTVSVSRIRDVLSSTRYRLNLVLTTSGIVILSLGMSFFPLYLSRAGLSAQLVGIVLSVRGIGQLLAPVIMGTLEGRAGRFWIVVSALGTGTLVLAGIPHLSTLGPFLAVSLVMGCAFGLIIPMSLVLAAEGTTKESRVFGLGLRFAFNRLTDSVSPIVFGSGTEVWGIAAPFRMAAAYLAVVLGVAVGSRRLFERTPSSAIGPGTPGAS